MRWGRVGAAGLAVALLWGLAAPARATSVGGIPRLSDATLGVLRTVCDLQWVEGPCEATGYADPQYRTTTEPDLGQPLRPRIGIVHEHSGYSDGDPTTRPADYFRAAREGHNVADAGGDTGIKVDFLISSEHTENEKLPITTAEACLNAPAIPASLSELRLDGAFPGLACPHLIEAEHHRKWDETLRQAVDATERTGGQYSGFTAMRGFEFTNDVANHLGVYFSRNARNAKIDGSYLSTDLFWDWLRRPAEHGGGSDGLVVFNHPGGTSNLTPFNDGAITGDVVQALLGAANWHDYAYVPSVDAQVSGMEVHGGDHIGWYVKALTNGWHLGPVYGEDEHQREWSSSEDGKTVMLTRGRSPRDYYFALQQRRTMAYSKDVVGGSPGQGATYPVVSFWADGASLDAPGAAPLGSRLRGGTHALELSATGLAPGSRAVLVRRAGGTPQLLGTAGANGSVRAHASLTAPATGEDWAFVVICGTDSRDCGRDGLHDVVTAPIWVRAA